MTYQLTLKKTNHSFTYSSYNDVIKHIVDSEYPFDPSDDEDVGIFLREVLNNQHVDIELARYELRDLRNDVATDVAELHDKLDKPQKFKNWKIELIQ